MHTDFGEVTNGAGYTESADMSTHCMGEFILFYSDDLSKGCKKVL